MTTETIQFDVNGGPSADRIIDALKYAFNPDCEIVTEFTLRNRSSRIKGSGSWHKTRVHVIGVTYESGSSGMFILTVDIDGYDTSQGFYNANTRTGVFDLKRYVR